MSFEVGRLSAALTLDGVPEFHRELDSAGRKLTETGQRGASFGKAGEAAVRAAAGATTTLVAAAGAYLTILTKQGIAYNSLQQNSRAALSVLLGGTEQANAQMAKLDDFARNSPFSKSVFIQAQQQLIGFGMEAAKVIPTLDAIQQGVAAMGGSNEQISEVVNILAKVQSTGKFTADTLNELGYRGVDAATLMGNAMGKSAAQMREDISKGAIGGAEAIEVLVSAMQDRFGGAADNVKQQWSGAVDRIKAAQRDLGAHIAEPFVSAQGGGMAVTWGNQVADVLRAIEKQAVPVMSILTQRGMPFFAGLTQGLDSARLSIQRWDASKLKVSLDKLANHAPGIAAVAGAFLALGANVGPLGQMLKVLGISANPVLAAFVGLAAASPELRQALGELLAAGKPLLPVLGELTKILSNTLNQGVDVAANGVRLLTSVLEPVVKLVAAIPAPVLAGAVAFLALYKSVQGLAPAFSAAQTMVQSFQDQMKLQQHLAAMSTSSMSELGVATVDVARTGGKEIGAFGAAASVAGSKVTGLGNAIKTAFLSNPIGIALTAVTAVIGLWAMANAAAQQKVEDHKNRVASLKDTLNETTGAITDATHAQIESNLADSEAKDLADKLGVSYRDVVDAAKGNEDAHTRVNAAMTAHLDALSATGLATEDTAFAYLKASGQADALRTIIDDMSGAQEEAQQTAREEARAHQEQAAAMGTAGRDSAKLKDALNVASDASRNAEERLNALRQALDLLNGGQKSAAEAELDHAKQMMNLRDALGQTVGEQGKLVDVLNASGGSLDMQSAEALRLGEVLVQLNRDTEAQAMAASDAKIATGDYAGAFADAQQKMQEGRKAFIDQAVAMGLNADVAGVLADKYYAIPEQVATILQMDGATEASSLLAIVLGQLSSLEAGGTTEIPVAAPGAQEAVAALEALGYTVEKTPDGKNFTITSLGKEQAVADLSEVAQMNPPDKLFLIDADAKDAYEKIDGVNVKQVDRKTVAVWGDNKNAVDSIEEINRKQPAKKVVTIDGDSSKFNTVWSNVVGRVGQAWVNIFGTKANSNGGMYNTGGQQFHNGGTVIARNFADSGFASGIYAGVMGGIPKMGVDGTPHLFAEKHLGVDWETYISSRASKSRNASLLMETAQRIGFPVIPVSALRGIRAFADGGTAGSAHAAPTQFIASEPGPRTAWNMTIVNPVVRDPFEQAWQQAQEKGEL